MYLKLLWYFNGLESDTKLRSMTLLIIISVNVVTGTTRFNTILSEEC